MLDKLQKTTLSLKTCCVKACVFQFRIKRVKEVKSLEEIIMRDRVEIQVLTNKTNE